MAGLAHVRSPCSPRCSGFTFPTYQETGHSFAEAAGLEDRASQGGSVDGSDCGPGCVDCR